MYEVWQADYFGDDTSEVINAYNSWFKAWLFCLWHKNCYILKSEY